MGVISPDGEIRFGVYRADYYGPQEEQVIWSSWIIPDAANPDFHIPSSFPPLLSIYYQKSSTNRHRSVHYRVLNGSLARYWQRMDDLQTSLSYYMTKDLNKQEYIKRISVLFSP